MIDIYEYIYPASISIYMYFHILQVFLKFKFCHIHNAILHAIAFNMVSGWHKQQERFCCLEAWVILSIHGQLLHFSLGIHCLSREKL